MAAKAFYSLSKSGNEQPGNLRDIRSAISKFVNPPAA